MDGRLALGTWQRIFMVELDGPRSREVMVRCHSYVPNGVLPTIEAKRNGVSKPNGHHHGGDAGFTNGK